MKGRVTLICLILIQAITFTAAWFGPGVMDLAKRVDHGYGKRRLRDELCDELNKSRHGRDEDMRREIERIRKLTDDVALKSLSDLLDHMDERSVGDAGDLIRHLMKKFGFPDAPVYGRADASFTADEAEKQCKSLGGKLAVIRNGMDQSLAWEMVYSASKSKVFIGLIKDISHIYWRDRSEIFFTNFEGSHWRRYEGSRRCGVMDRESGTWSFTSCNARLPFLCQLPKKMPIKPPTPPPKYRLLSGGSIKSDTAEERCKALGGRLAIIRSVKDQSLARTVSSKASYHKVFIGLIKDRHGYAYWRDGTRMTFYAFRSNYWRRYKGYRMCGVIDRRTGAWDFVSCNSRLPAMCQVSMTTSPKPPTGPSNKKKYFETELRFMFEYERSIKDKRFSGDLVSAIGQLLQKNTNYISVLSMRRGSTIVRVRIYISDKEDAEKLKEILQRESKMGGILDMRFHGRLRPVIDPHGRSGRPMMLKIVIPIVVLIVVVLAVVVALVMLMLRKRQRNVRPTAAPVAQEPERLPTYNEFTANDYTKPPSEPNAPPAYNDISKHPIA